LNGKWPLVLYTDSNRAEFGGNLDAVGELKGSSLNITGSAAISSTLTAGFRITGKTLRVGPWIGDYLYWLMDNYNDENLGFYQERFSNGQTQIVLKGYIEDDGNGYSQMNFTGQHRCFIKKLPFSNTKEYEGMIVCADQNIYISMSNKIEKGNKAITQNESLPYVSLS
jgi:hypothetical protein